MSLKRFYVGRLGLTVLVGFCILVSIAILVAVRASTRGSSETKRQTSSPNVILIVADDIGWECFGFNGAEQYQTPNLDRLAKNGFRFNHCYSHPLCTPSRVKLMTGLYGFRNYDAFGYLSPYETTFGQQMQSAGYRTCIAGKWQLNGRPTKEDGYKDKLRPMEMGFQSACLWNVTREGECYHSPTLEIDGELVKDQDGKYGPDVCLDFIKEFIQDNQDEPMFVYYPMILAHRPFQPPPNYRGKSVNRFAEDVAHFPDMVNYADFLVGELVSHLESLGLDEETIVMFTCDNGSPPMVETTTNGKIVLGGKGELHNRGTHVPLIVRWPSRNVTGSSNEMVDFADFVPTLAEISGTLSPKISTDGVSFLPTLLGESRSPKPYAYCFYDPRFGRFSQYAGEFIRDQRFKLYGDGRLYDMEIDPMELEPIPKGENEEDTTRERLQSALARIRSESI